MTIFTFVHHPFNDTIYTIIILGRNRGFIDIDRFLFPLSIPKSKLRLVDFNLF